MNEPVDYLTFEERVEMKRVTATIEAMVEPTVEDATDLL
jgi:hypothetical protein